MSTTLSKTTIGSLADPQPNISGMPAFGAERTFGHRENRQ
jgi:hypothetical protein